MQAKDSLWIHETYRQNFDFLILGNGFTGMQTALQLIAKYPQKSVGIVDQSYISGGASLRNAGFACFGSVGEILDDLQSSTETEVLELVQMRFQGLKYLQEDFKNIDYQVGKGQELFLESETAHYEHSLEHVSWVNNRVKSITGSADTFYTRKHSLGTSFQPFAISNSIEGSLHSGKLYHRMQQKVIASGVFWISEFKINEVQKNSSHFDVIAETGKTLQAAVVISCLNAFTGQVQKAAHLIPARGQIIVTKALNQNPLSGIIHADKGYIYARNIGNRILIGGGRNLDMNTEETLKMETNSMITEFLLDFVNSKLLSNETTQIEDTWSCIMGMSSNKGALPIIEEVQPGYWACYRLGGMGVALSSLLARKLVHMI